MLRSILRKSVPLIGRRNLYRVSRFLSMAARGDVPNDPATNGEWLVQGIAIQIDPTPTVFDVGANIGDWTASMLQVAGSRNISIYAFEPCSATFAQLSERIKSPQVALVRTACGRQSGTAIMSVFFPGAGINTLVRDPSAASTEEVPVISVDEYCSVHSIPCITLLKIDAEGYDFEILAGARRMLATKAVRILQFEYSRHWIGTRNCLKDAFDFLCPIGYQIGKLAGSAVEFYQRWHWEMETYREANYIACLPEIASHFRQQKPTWLFNGQGS